MGRTGRLEVLVADLPCQETRLTARNGESCLGGIYRFPPPPPVTGQESLCCFLALGNQVLGSSYAYNSGFCNPTGGDVARYAKASSGLGPPPRTHHVGCFAGNTGLAGLTSAPRRATLVSLLVVLAEGAARLFALCAAVLGLHYPRSAAHFLLPMPAAQLTMPGACAGVPASPWCPAGG